MRAWVVDSAFGLENLKLVEMPKPSAGHGELLVRVRAVSLNYRDLLVVRGLYDPRFRLPLVPCSDAACVVEEVGPGVEGFEPGDRVCPIFAPRWLDGRPSREQMRTTLGGPLDGTLREWMAVPAESVVRIPSFLSDVEAASLPCAGVTAWHALFGEAGPVQPGDTVAVLGSGGVSVFALQLARAAGARVVATSSSDAKRRRLEELGAFATVNYREEPRWGRALRELTGGVDHVVEVGGAGTLAQSLEAVRAGGTVSVIGVLSGVRQPLDVLPILMKNVRVQGIFVGHRAHFRALVRALEASTIHPVVDRVFALEQAPDAFAHLASGAHFGKVCIAVA